MSKLLECATNCSGHISVVVTKDGLAQEVVTQQLIEDLIGEGKSIGLVLVTSVYRAGIESIDNCTRIADKYPSNVEYVIICDEDPDRYQYVTEMRKKVDVMMYVGIMESLFCADTFIGKIEGGKGKPGIIVRSEYDGKNIMYLVGEGKHIVLGTYRTIHQCNREETLKSIPIQWMHKSHQVTQVDLVERLDYTCKYLKHRFKRNYDKVEISLRNNIGDYHVE